MSPSQDAQFWCEIGLDKDGFERRFISQEIGMSRHSYYPCVEPERESVCVGGGGVRAPDHLRFKKILGIAMVKFFGALLV